jgi:tetratricopeptide (TPR) repeat protein
MAKKKFLTEAKKREALSLIQNNRFSEAKLLLEEICRLDNRDAEGWNILGGLNGHLGCFDQAEICCRKAVLLRPGFAEACDNLGAALQQLNRNTEALTYHKRAIRINPQLFSACYHMGNAYRNLHQFQEAALCYRQALEQNPGFSSARNNLGSVLLASGDLPGAEQCFKEALHVNPEDAGARENLALTLQRQRNFEGAISNLERLLSTSPNSFSPIYRLAVLYHELGRYSEAEPYLRRLVLNNPANIELQQLLGDVFHKQGKLEQALATFRAIERTKPGCPDTAGIISCILQSQGDYERAYQTIQLHINTDTMNVNVAVAFALLSPRHQLQEKAITNMEAIVQQQGLDSASRARLCHQLGVLYDGIGDYEKAFEKFTLANSLKSVGSHPSESSQAFDALISSYSDSFLGRIPRASNTSARPVFIVGMPRSGTSLVEQILSSHPLIGGGGELDNITTLMRTLPTTLKSRLPYPQCIESVTTPVLDHMASSYLTSIAHFPENLVRVTDKMPNNFLHLGLIALLFPSAHIIHCVRDPLDTCLSCYFQDFSALQPYTCDLKRLGNYYANYQRLMAHWKQVLTLPVLEVKYEDLVDEQEELSRKMIEFCGLEWDKRCLEFHNNKRYVNTASYDQVRQLIYTKSVGRWKHYKNHIAPLIEVLANPSG